MKKTIFISLLLACCFHSSAQNADFSTRDSLASDKIFFNILALISPFQSLGIGYEKTLTYRNTIDVEIGYIYNSWFTRNTTGLIGRSSYKYHLYHTNHSRIYTGVQGVYHWDIVKLTDWFTMNDDFFKLISYKRTKNRFSLFLLLGAEFEVSSKINFDINLGLGARYMVINDNVPDGYIQRTPFIDSFNFVSLFTSGTYFYPDSNISFRFKFDL